MRRDWRKRRDAGGPVIQRKDAEDGQLEDGQKEEVSQLEMSQEEDGQEEEVSWLLDQIEW